MINALLNFAFQGIIDTYLGDPSNCAVWNSRHNRAVPLTFAQSHTIKCASFQLYGAELTGISSSCYSSLPAAGKLQIIHRCFHLPKHNIQFVTLRAVVSSSYIIFRYEKTYRHQPQLSMVNSTFISMFTLILPHIILAFSWKLFVRTCITEGYADVSKNRLMNQISLSANGANGSRGTQGGQDLH